MKRDPGWFLFPIFREQGIEPPERCPLLLFTGAPSLRAIANSNPALQFAPSILSLGDAKGGRAKNPIRVKENRRDPACFLQKVIF